MGLKQGGASDKPSELITTATKYVVMGFDFRVFMMIYSENQWGIIIL